MTLPSVNPALPDQPNPYFLDNAFVRGDEQRANNGFIWNNLQDLDDRVTDTETDIIKTAIDYSKPIGEVFFLPENRASEFTFDSLNPRDYFPAINLSAIDGSESFTSSDIPLGPLNYLGTLRIKYLPGRSGEVDEWTVTVAGLVVTFPNTASANAILAALVEDDAINGNANSINRTLIIDGAQFTVASSGVNLVTRAVTMLSSPPSGTKTAYWLAYGTNASGSGITVQSISGEGLMSPNDPDGYFIMNLRTRGYTEKHRHYLFNAQTSSSGNITSTSTANFSNGITNNNAYIIQRGATALLEPTLGQSSIQVDDVSGDALTRNITHGPAYTLIPYMWCGG